jgi:hypothetical protein
MSRESSRNGSQLMSAERIAMSPNLIGSKQSVERNNYQDQFKLINNQSVMSTGAQSRNGTQ